ncbi:NAD(P)-dependent oxidoreductase [Nocardia sp. NPDC057353]|uniref:NAD(P)-dependent oxidoreductase n=1 Tax=Nocardia sp. NPDC057353 TaxID=3346104 RepID=UPI003631E100
MRVGFIGAGRMGAPMVARLVGAGHDVRALGRSAEARAAVAETGAAPVATAAEAIGGADAVVLCVFTDDQVREICSTETFGDATVIVHTTGSPETVGAVADRGIRVVDAPVSGGPHDIARGTLTVFLGGADSDVTVAREVLRAYADPILHVGGLGSGQRVKLVNNALFAAQIGLVADAVRFGAELGLPEDALLAALPHASGNSRALAGIAAKGSVAEFRSSVGEFLRKDVTVARSLADALGADLGILTAPIETGVARP